MDDIILLYNNKAYLQDCFAQIKDICKNELKLTLNPKKTQIGKVYNGIDFLGFNYKITATGKSVVKLRQSAKIRMKWHVKNLKWLHNNGIVDHEFVEQRKNAFKAHLSHSDECLSIISSIARMGDEICMNRI